MHEKELWRGHHDNVAITRSGEACRCLHHNKAYQKSNAPFALIPD